MLLGLVVIDDDLGVAILEISSHVFIETPIGIVQVARVVSPLGERGGQAATHRAGFGDALTMESILLIDLLVVGLHRLHLRHENVACALIVRHLDRSGSLVLVTWRLPAA